MKIIHVIFSLQIGGSETMLVDILNEQVRTLHQVSLIIINKDWNSDLVSRINPEVKITKLLRRKGYNSLWVGAKINLLLLKERPDVIHFHDHTGIDYLLLKNKYRTVLTLHSLNLNAKSWHKYTKVAAISKMVKRDTFDRSGIEAELIYNGVRISEIEKKADMPRRMKVVQVGRLIHEVKGQDVLLRAVSILQTKYPKHKIEVDFIGEGASLDFLNKLSQELGVKDVRFLGMKNRAYVYKKLCSYDLLVQPSNDEGFGLTVAEALAANIQVLVSEIAAPMEVIDEGKYGFSFNVGDSEDCAKQLERILIQGETKDMSEVNEYLAENFDIHQTAMKYIALYEKIAKNKERENSANK